MRSRRVYDSEPDAHFLTFSCYKRRRLLDVDRCKRIVISTMDSGLRAIHGNCIGFVIMPNHVHTLVWAPVSGRISEFLQDWKQTSSARIKQCLAGSTYASRWDTSDPVWQSRYYDFNVFHDAKVIEKLTYMHENPVKAGLVMHPCDWEWSSARHYECGRSVGIPIRYSSEE